MSKIDSQPQLNKEIERTLAEFYETRYFQALTELCNNETAIALDALLDKNKSESELRFYQGRVEEVKTLLERIASLHEEIIKNPSEE